MLTIQIAPEQIIELWKLPCGETFVHNNKLYIYAYIKGEKYNKSDKNKLPAINLENGELVELDKLILVTPVNVNATIELKCLSGINYNEVSKAYEEKGYNSIIDNFNVELCEEALGIDY